MALAVALQMDPLATIDPDADSSLALALEAQRRGHAVHHYTPAELTLDGRVLRARGRAVVFERAREPVHARGPETDLDLAGMDVILMRQDPPFDMAYVTATHLLEAVHPRTLVVNDPAAVRDAPEKLFVTRFPEFTPATAITRSRAEIDAFRERHGDIILKPLHGNGGDDVFHVRPDDPNLGALVEMLTRVYRDPLVVQRYLPEIRKGDKRVLLVEGEPVGAVNRVPAARESRANFHAGGRAEPARVGAREREICAAIGPTLRARGVVFAGIDVIGGLLTEINVTSPTGIQEVARLEGVDTAGRVWDAIETRLAGPVTSG